jgi:hypothetical protein
MSKLTIWQDKTQHSSEQDKSCNNVKPHHLVNSKKFTGYAMRQKYNPQTKGKTVKRNRPIDNTDVEISLQRL